MLSTKQFADLCQTTKKTIIHYDRIGLLKPAQVFETNRKYNVRQVLDFQKIAMFKSFGYNLNSIRSLLNENDLTAIFAAQKDELEKLKQTTDRKLFLLDQYLKNLSSKQTLVNPKVKNVGPYRYYAIRKTCRYIDIGLANQELAHSIEDTEFKRQYLTIFHTDTYAPDASDMTIGALITDKNPKMYPNIPTETIPKQRALVFNHVGSYRYLSFVWQFMFEYAKKHGIQHDPRYPNREIYRLGSLYESNEDNLITEIQLPILEK